MSMSDDSRSDIPEEPFDQAFRLQEMMETMVVASWHFDEEAYIALRRELMRDNATKKLIPSFVQKYRTERALWAFFGSYNGNEREALIYISDKFQPLFEHIESNPNSPVNDALTDALSQCDSKINVKQVWEKALSRRNDDPEGAITAARTLVETVCKLILDKHGKPYTNSDLPKLYRAVAEVLELAPSQYSEEAFKTILGGCHTVVNGLGTLRNKVGDAHGQGRKTVRPTARHATLAVNLAGTMATFLIETWLKEPQTSKINPSD